MGTRKIVNKKNYMPAPLRSAVRTVIVQPSRKIRNNRRSVYSSGAGTVKQMGKDLLYGLGSSMLGPASRIFKPVIDSGIDYLGTFISSSSDNTFGTSGVPGQVVQSFTIAPAALQNTRIAKMSQLYQRFLFSKVIIKYMPAINVTQSGQLIGYFDTDPEQSPPAGLAGVNYANAHGGVIFQISQPASFIMPIIKDRTYYTDYDGAAALDEERFKIQAVFRALIVAPVPSSSSIGTFTIEYECAFELPQIDSGDVSVGDPGGYFGYQGPGLSYIVALNTNVRLFAVVLATAASFNAPIPTISSQMGTIWSSYGAASTNGLKFATSSLPTNPIYFTTGYYVICFQITASAGTILFPASGAFTSYFSGVSTSTFTNMGVGIRSTNAASATAVIFLSFSIMNPNLEPVTFDPLCTTTSTCVVSDYSVGIVYGFSSFVKTNKHPNVTSQIDELTRLYNAQSCLNVLPCYNQIPEESDAVIIPPNLFPPTLGLKKRF